MRAGVCGFMGRATGGMLAAALALLVVASPGLAATSFSTSFEADEPAPDWADTAETNAAGNKKMSGVTGTTSSGLSGSIRDKVEEVTASGTSPANESPPNLNDGNANSKWLAFQSTGWAQYRLSEPIAVMRYALTSANDASDRDPRDWSLQGSDDGSTWTTLDRRTDESFADRFETREFAVENETAYEYYRLDVDANSGDDALQLAELELSDGDTTPPPVTDMKSFVSTGPVNGATMKPNAGFTGLGALQYGGGHTVEGHGYAYNKVFNVDVEVTSQTELSYLIFPEFTTNDLGYPSTYAAVDLAFTDGTYLSELGVRDHHGFELSPQGQGRSRSVYPDQWNFRRARIGDVAAGKTITRILVAYDKPAGPGLFNGWVDDIVIAPAATPEPKEHPTDHVLTTRGTHSSGGFSRGNNIPATAVPNGFNFWTPVTDAGSTSWLYEYHADNNDANLPEIEAFSVSHEPSPWMGDRQTFQVMPSASETPDARREARALAFRHANEVAKPHRYGVEFENGIRTDLAPTDHAAIFRFEFTGDASSLVFDNVSDAGGLTVDEAAGTVSGYSDVRSGLSEGATRLFVHATFDRPVTAGGSLDGDPGGDVTGYVGFDTSAEKVVTMRIATSLISVDQAKKNLALELAPTDTFATVAERARQKWDERLGVVEVEGATEDQLTTLYSSLYRLHLYPNAGHENTGSAEHPTYAYASPFSKSEGASTATQTGAKIVEGKVFVNNGFWDTYRTTWPAYSLFAPEVAGELVDGFVQQYRDGGWLTRWSSPGYADLMTGTSSDVAFADAYVKGVTGFDAEAGYDAALKNATVNPLGEPDGVGRKGIESSIFLGYTPSSTDESASWGLEGFINDFGIANMAKALADRPGIAEATRRRYAEEHEYFLDRARNYANMFDPSIGFFQAKTGAGAWNTTSEEFDARVWGHEFTETNGWNFAFHAPQDGQGLANLLGGRDKLAAKLDEFFSTPETARFPGSYGGTIHEMVEARDVRMGQYGHSNQVSHHIPYMYDYTGQPAKAQEKVRDVLARLYTGSEIGQGYPGDEDNGEMSAWYVFSALGFYPLQVGSPYYAIGSPLFRKATVHLPGGDLVIEAPENSDRNVYVQGVKLNGAEHSKTFLTHADLARGGRLEFAMGPEPSAWGTGEADAPPSLTKPGARPDPLRDITGPERGVATAEGGVDVARLFDNTSGSRVSFASQTPWVQYAFGGSERRRVTFYTLTSGRAATKDTEAPGDPRSWVLKGSDDGETWTVVDERSGEEFRWRLQTRAFKIAHPGAFRQYRLEVTGTTGEPKTSLAEIELLARPGDAEGEATTPTKPGAGADTPGQPAAPAAPPAGKPAIVRIARRVLRVGRDRRVRVAVRCPSSTANRCSGVLTLLSGRLVVGRATISVAPDASRTVTLRVSRSALEALQRRRGGPPRRVSVELLTRGADGVLRRAAARLPLRLAPRRATGAAAR